MKPHVGERKSSAQRARKSAQAADSISLLAPVARPVARSLTHKLATDSSLALVHKQTTNKRANTKTERLGSAESRLLIIRSALPDSSSEVPEAAMTTRATSAPISRS